MNTNHNTATLYCWHIIDIPDNTRLNEISVESVTSTYTGRIEVYNENDVLICDNGVPA